MRDTRTTRFGGNAEARRPAFSLSPPPRSALDRIGSGRPVTWAIVGDELRRNGETLARLIDAARRESTQRRLLCAAVDRLNAIERGQTEPF